MNADLYLLVVAFLAIGWGVSIGWVLHAKHQRANPEGVAKVAAAATAQVEMARHDAEVAIQRIREVANDSNAALVEQLSAWQAHARYLATLAGSSAPPVIPSTPPPPPRVLDLDQSIARVTGEGLDPETAARDKMSAKTGLSLEKVDALLAGKLDNVPTSELLEQVTDDIVRASTGVT